MRKQSSHSLRHFAARHGFLQGLCLLHCFLHFGLVHRVKEAPVEWDDLWSVAMRKTNIIANVFTLESIDLVKRHRNSVINTSEDKSDPEFESALWVCWYYLNLAIENHIFVSKIGYFFLYDLHSSYTL